MKRCNKEQPLEAISYMFGETIIIVREPLFGTKCHASKSHPAYHR